MHNLYIDPQHNDGLDNKMYQVVQDRALCLPNAMHVVMGDFQQRSVQTLLGCQLTGYGWTCHSAAYEQPPIADEPRYGRPANLDDVWLSPNLASSIVTPTIEALIVGAPVR